MVTYLNGVFSGFITFIKLHVIFEQDVVVKWLEHSALVNFMLVKVCVIPEFAIEDNEKRI